MKKHPRLGSTLVEFLDQDGIRAKVDAAVTKRLLVLQIEKEMRRLKMTKAALADRMQTSRMAVKRLLDTTSGSVTLGTMSSAASAIGRDLKILLVKPAKRSA